VIKSVQKAFRILKLFNSYDVRLSLNEISKKLGIPKSTTYNLLDTLRHEDFIEKVDGDMYSLGTGILSLSQNARVNIEIRDPAAPVLRKLADKARESVYLTIKNGDFALYIYAIESSKRLLARSAVGDRVPLHCTAVGKAILAFLPDEEIQAIISRVGLPTYTENTIGDPDLLMKEITKIRKSGYSIDNSEHELNIYCIGAPILDRKGLVIGSCSVSSADYLIIAEKREHLSALVINSAQEISRLFGYVQTKPSTFFEKHT